MTDHPIIIADRVRAFDHVLSWCGDDSRFDTLVQLLTDAMHWSDANSESFHYAMALAGKNYLDHLNQERNPS